MKVGDVVLMGKSVGVVVATHGDFSPKLPDGTSGPVVKDCCTVGFPDERRTETVAGATLVSYTGEQSNLVRATVDDLAIDQVADAKTREKMIELREERRFGGKR